LITSLEHSSELLPTEICLYSDPVATADQVGSELKRLVALFPALGKDFIIGLTDLITREQFTALRLRDAIDNVAKNCPYAAPTAANILGFGKKKVLSHGQVCDKVDKEGCKWTDFTPITLPGDVKRWTENI
jgi:hypothetical protein